MVEIDEVKEALNNLTVLGWTIRPDFDASYDKPELDLFNEDDYLVATLKFGNGEWTMKEWRR